MKKFGFSVGVLFFCAAMLLGFAGCSNSAGGGSSESENLNDYITFSADGKILDMRIKKNGVAYASQNLISKSITTGYDDGSIFTRTDELLESEHVKIEKLSNGLKFTITRPEQDCYNPSKYRDEAVYEWVGDGNGSYACWVIDVGEGNGNLKDEYVYVGQGNGGFKFENNVYEWVGQGNGSYECRSIDVGEGNGNLRHEYKEVGQGNGGYSIGTKKVYGGWGYTAIYREEKIDGKVLQSTCAVLSNRADDGTVECFYPLCESGERYVFKVQIEPIDVNTYRDYQRYEWLVVDALGGVGDIDYSNINVGRHCNLTYDGTKPALKLVDCIAPNAKNVKPLIAYFVTDSTDESAIDWETSNATKWLYEHEGSFKIPQKEIEEFKYKLVYSGKSRFFAQFFFSFEVDASSGIKQWRTAGIDSQIVSFR